MACTGNHSRSRNSHRRNHVFHSHSRSEFGHSQSRSDFGHSHDHSDLGHSLSHVASAETAHVASAETAHLTAAEATPVSSASASATAATSACLRTRRQQTPGKQRGCQYHHRSSLVFSHDFFLSTGRAIDDHRTSRPTVIWSPRLQIANREISKPVIGAADGITERWHQHRKRRCRSARSIDICGPSAPDRRRHDGYGYVARRLSVQ